MAAAKDLSAKEVDRLLDRVVHPLLLVSPKSYVADLRSSLAKAGIQKAVAQHDTASIFDWLLNLLQLQGISDAAALSYVAQHGLPPYGGIDMSLDRAPTCPLLRSYWHFADCGYRKTSRTCSQPNHFGRCPVPLHPFRKGLLNQTACSLFLFLRDVCDGDLVAWIDERLAVADGVRSPRSAYRSARVLTEALGNVFGVSDKLWSMALSDLLLGRDPRRQRWVATGAAMIAVDTLVHKFFHRTGVLRRLSAEHGYGPRCYQPNGCADIIVRFASLIDGRELNPEFPAYFPRFIQHAIWRFCAQGVLNVCNGNRIDDKRRCSNINCALYFDCERVPLRDSATARGRRAM
jgi:hypothetical protein